MAKRRLVSPANLGDAAKPISIILEGLVKRADVDTGMKIYECKDVIRIDLKVEEVKWTYADSNRAIGQDTKRTAGDQETPW